MFFDHESLRTVHDAVLYKYQIDQVLTQCRPMLIVLFTGFAGKLHLVEANQSGVLS